MGEKEREVILSLGWLRAGIEADYNLMMAAKSVARSAKDMYSEFKSQFQTLMYIIIRLVQQ